MTPLSDLVSFSFSMSKSTFFFLRFSYEKIFSVIRIIASEVVIFLSLAYEPFPPVSP